jgi:hypothetical protein
VIAHVATLVAAGPRALVAALTTAVVAALVAALMAVQPQASWVAV